MQTEAIAITGTLYLAYTGNLQSSTLSKHDNSAQHRDALCAHAARQKLFKTDLEADSARRNTNGNDGLEDEDIKYQPSESELALFRTVCYVGMNDLANLQVNPLLHMQRLNGMNCKFVDVQQLMLYKRVSHLLLRAN